jgi:hypothetical protein
MCTRNFLLFPCILLSQQTRLIKLDMKHAAKYTFDKVTMQSRLFFNFRNFGFSPKRSHCYSHLTNLYNRNLCNYSKSYDGEVLKRWYLRISKASQWFKNYETVQEREKKAWSHSVLSFLQKYRPCGLKKQLCTWCLNYTIWQISDFCSRRNIIQLVNFNFLISVQIKQLYNVWNLQKYYQIYGT